VISLQILALALLSVGSIALATVEAAFYLAKRRRLAHFAEHKRGELLSQYVADPPALLMPIHMGTYTAHVAMTVVITAIFFGQLRAWAMVVAFLAMVIYLLLFRLTVPYAVVRRNPERALVILLPFFHVYARALSPLVAVLRRRAAGANGEAEEPARHAPGAEVPPPPVHDEDEGRLVDAVTRFSTMLVRDVMTPRPDVVAISLSASICELRRMFRETKYSRLPVYGDNLDDIQGVVSVRDLMEAEGGDDPAPLKPLMRPPFLVPETKKVSDLLKELQASRTTFAVVIDEYGGTAGVVSMEDIVEELVGEIKDEYDVEVEPLAVEPDGSVVASGRLNVDRLEQAVEADLLPGDEVGTVGGLVATAFGRIPRTGENLVYRGFKVEVLDADAKRVSRVRFRRLGPPPPP
jgi:magnesium and cobalt transporter